MYHLGMSLNTWEGVPKVLGMNAARSSPIFRTLRQKAQLQPASGSKQNGTKKQKGLGGEGLV